MRNSQTLIDDVLRLTADAMANDERSYYGQVARTINVLHSTEHTADSVRGIWRRHRSRVKTEYFKPQKTFGLKRRVPYKSRGNILFIGDPHAPFTLPGYLDFLYRLQTVYDVTDVFCVGDIVDQYALSFFDKMPEAYDIENELLKAMDFIREMAQVFPYVNITMGNHDNRYLRQATKSGLPRRMLRDLDEVLEAPDTWEWNLSYIIDEHILLEHGTSSGANATIDRMWGLPYNVVQGHTHNYGGVSYRNNGFSTRWAMNVGCGFDADSYAARYATDRKYQPTLGAGLYLKGEELPLFVPFKG